MCYTSTRTYDGPDGGALGGAVPVALWSTATRAPVDPTSLSSAHAAALSDYISARPPVALSSEADAVAQGHRLGLEGMARVLEDAGRGEDAGVVRTAASGSLPLFLIHIAGLWDVQPTRPHVTIISRRNKRLILNEPELVRVITSLPAALDPLDGGRGIEVELASLETMPLYEQLRLFRRTTVLVGIHGSGLINSVFMHRGAALVQLMPYHVNSGATFFSGPAEMSGVKYLGEWGYDNILYYIVA